MMTTIQLLGALGLLFIGGEALVRGASALALRLGIPALAVGLTVVAFGTSAPELVVSVDAALSGVSDISLGNVVGSNIANIALILGLAVVVRPITSHAKVIRVDAPLMVVASLALAVVMANRAASRYEGVLLLVGLIAYVAWTVRQATRESNVVQRAVTSSSPAPPSGALASVSLIVTGLLLLVGGGHLMVSTAVRLATALGVSEATIGLTIVAVGTSLPELATSVVASARGQGDIAIGNVVGSNVFNVLGILGLTAVVRPLDRGGVTWLDIGIMVLLAVALVPLLLTRSRLDRPEGAMLLVAYGSYTAYLLAA